MGEWSPVESLQGSLPDPPNPILTHVVFRLLDQVDPPQPPPTPPHMPRFRLQACILGKPFSGKSSVLSHLKESKGILPVTYASFCCLNFAPHEIIANPSFFL